MDKSELVQHIISSFSFCQNEATAFAPANIALVKYWGKRDEELNSPVTSSLSVSLGLKGATTTIKKNNNNNKSDLIILNNQIVSEYTVFYKRITEYLSLFRPEKDFYFHIDTSSTVPIASGLASSACGFSALILALNQFFNWKLSDKSLSILARLGSGSASRSLWAGFVLWYRGEQENSLDSYAELLKITWPEFRLGIVLNATGEKEISSREAMKHTQKTSPFYSLWEKTVSQDLAEVQKALAKKDFTSLGETAEANAQAMHALINSSRPAIYYGNSATYSAILKVYDCRRRGIEVYFTQDAGPHIKLLFLKKDEKLISDEFSASEIIEPFCRASC